MVRGTLLVAMGMNGGVQVKPHSLVSVLKFTSVAWAYAGNSPLGLPHLRLRLERAARDGMMGGEATSYGFLAGCATGSRLSYQNGN